MFQKLNIALNVYLLVTMILLLDHRGFAQSQLSNILDQDMIQEIQKGIFNQLDAKDINDVASSTFIIGTNSENIYLTSQKNVWSSTDCQYIRDAISSYLDKRNFRAIENNYSIIMNHIKKFTAFKTAVYTIYSPTQSLGKVIGDEIARGILFASRLTYPTDIELDQIKSQNQIACDLIAESLLKLTDDDESKAQILKETAMMQEALSWRSESPFFEIGKKVFQEDAFLKILKSISDYCSNNFHLDEYKTSLEKESLTQFIITSNINLYIKKNVDAAISPLITEYAKGMNREASLSEQIEMRDILTRLSEIQTLDMQRKYHLSN